MINNIYTLEFDLTFRLYEFESIGTEGIVKKVVQYTEANLKDYVERKFIVFGLRAGVWEQFKKDIVYDAFLVRKRLNFV